MGPWAPRVRAPESCPDYGSAGFSPTVAHSLLWGAPLVPGSPGLRTPTQKQEVAAGSSSRAGVSSCRGLCREGPGVS